MASVRLDPLPAFNFVVQLIETDGAVRTVAGFNECSGLESTLEIGGVSGGRCRRSSAQVPNALLVQ